ncbi:RuvB DNA helicase-like protein [Gregarina niphandrodes]|uniref:RuvB-like helicase n=1 Tax=Gregarina niphandrodes TaxID=110365 RepID=A0A023B5Y7_GRENI|nr:RuvB DNA helicase-like protein [Gregarina niphandrodes]EZG64344.1 RuvB DNA helicase-like protein [Gregarina niphandrodes]|eukprot:XP_011130644.1 RuvB DNA helicase-like protein [Gregarina niphandrodes]
MLSEIALEARTLAKVARVGTHSHIRGIDDLVGQRKARRAASVVAKMIEEGRLAGRVVLLSGRPGTGKTALALGMARELGGSSIAGGEVPFVHMTASEVFSLDISKTEVLTQGLRKAIGVRVRETTEVLDGEVVELSIETPSGPTQSRRGTMTLKTTDMESLYNLGPKMIASLEQQKVTAGDVISVNKSTGRVTKVGRSFMRSTEYDAVCHNLAYVHCPEGEIQKTKEVVHSVTLHEIDVINSRTQGFLALFAGDTGEIKQEVRHQVDSKVAEWREEQKAEIVSGVLFIDESHLLDLECYSYLNRALELENAPLVILATNRGVTKIRGTEDEQGPHGIPIDFLDRTLIIPTDPYTPEEIKCIIQLRLTEEEIIMEPDALQLLVTIATDTSLRYALHLVSIAGVYTRKLKSTKITIQHVQHVYNLFIDIKRSTHYLQQYENQFL